MIVVTGTIELHPEDMWPATTAAGEMIRQTEKEDGCITYRFCVDINHLTRFRLYEEWRDEAALAAHMKAPHMAEFLARIEKLRVVSRDIVKFEVSETQPI